MPNGQGLSLTNEEAGRRGKQTLIYFPGPWVSSSVNTPHLPLNITCRVSPRTFTGEISETPDLSGLLPRELETGGTCSRAGIHHWGTQLQTCRRTLPPPAPAGLWGQGTVTEECVTVTLARRGTTPDFP